MTSIRDATAILNEDSALFAFLPAANYVFLISKDSSLIALAITIVTILFSATLYNVIRGKPEFTTTSRVVLTLVAGIWLVSLIYSMRELFLSFSETTVIPEILFFISTIFVSLILTDAVARNTLLDYDSPF